MLKISEPEKIQTAPAGSPRVEIRAELERTRAAFHQRLSAAAQSGWKQKSPNSAWTLQEIFVHLTWALECLPEEINRARRRRGMFNLPKRLADPASYWYIRWIARSATPTNIARRYDQAMAATLALLETITAEEWGTGADFYSEGFHSVEDLFYGPAKHLAEHVTGP